MLHPLVWLTLCCSVCIFFFLTCGDEFSLVGIATFSFEFVERVFVCSVAVTMVKALLGSMSVVSVGLLAC